MWVRALLLTAAIVAAPSVASAYCRTTTRIDFTPNEAVPCDLTGTPLFWPSRCASVFVGPSSHVRPSDAQRLVSLAFQQWSSADCSLCGGQGVPSFDVVQRGPAACDAGYQAEGPNVNMVVFHDTGLIHEDPGLLALTTVTFRTGDGSILDADIEVASDATHLLAIDAVAPDRYDLRSILTHEAGHFVGLAHSTAPFATMAPRYGAGDTYMRDLSNDDICGVCAAAPPSRDVPCVEQNTAECGPAPSPADPPSGGGCSITSHASPTGAVLFALAFLVTRRRSRTRARSCIPPRSRTRCTSTRTR